MYVFYKYKNKIVFGSDIKKNYWIVGCKVDNPDIPAIAIDSDDKEKCCLMTVDDSFEEYKGFLKFDDVNESNKVAMDTKDKSLMWIIEYNDKYYGFEDKLKPLICRSNAEITCFVEDSRDTRVGIVGKYLIAFGEDYAKSITIFIGYENNYYVYTLEAKNSDVVKDYWDFLVKVIESGEFETWRNVAKLYKGKYKFGLDYEKFFSGQTDIEKVKQKLSSEKIMKLILGGHQNMAFYNFELIENDVKKLNNFVPIPGAENVKIIRDKEHIDIYIGGEHAFRFGVVKRIETPETAFEGDYLEIFKLCNENSLCDDLNANQIAAWANLVKQVKVECR